MTMRRVTLRVATGPPIVGDMDPDDAQGVLLEWMEFLAGALSQGLIDIGGEVKTEVTSGAGCEYRVHVTSAAGDPGRVRINGRIHSLDTAEVMMLEERAEMEMPAGPS